MQFKGFRSIFILNEEKKLIPLSNDLRDLELWLRDLDARIARLTSNEPIANPPDGGPNNVPLAHHAWQHATLSEFNFSPTAGTDPLGVYPFTWERGHTWEPATSATVPITISLAASQTADAVAISTSDGTRLFTVDNVNAVGVNEDDPQAHLVVQATGFDPASLTPSYWFVADDLTGSDGDTVTTWPGRSPANLHTALAGSTSGPLAISVLGTVVRTTALQLLNGHQVSQWNGAGSHLGMLINSPITLGDYTLFVVYKTSGTAVEKAPWISVGTTDTIQYFLDFPTSSTGGTLSNSMIGVYNATEVQFDGTQVTLGAWGVHTLSRSASSHTYRRDGTGYPNTSGASAAAFTATGLGFHSNNSGGYQLLDGQMAELLLFNSALSLGDIENVEDYLNNRYNLNGGGTGGVALPLTYWQDTSGDVQAQMDEGFNLGLGIDPSTKLHVVDVTEQVRVGYDVSNYLSVTVGSGGDVTFAPSGGDSTITGDLTVTGTFDSGAAKFAVDSAGNITKINNVTTSWPASQGAADRYLRNDGSGTLTWAAVSLTAGVTGTLPATSGGTGFASYTVGDLLYADTTTSLAKRGIGSTGDILRVTGGVPVWASLSGAGVAPNDATYVTLATNATLTNERVLTNGTGITFVDAGAGSTITANLNNTAVTPATYGSATQVGQFTVDQQGRLTFAQNVTISGVAPSAHNILSASHGDTLTATVVRGDILRGNSTPAWSRLAIGTSTQFLKSDGTDAAWASGAALTKVDDTNVTLTLGGSATTALVNAASLTLGWTGTLSIARGGTAGTATPTNGGVAYGTGTAYAFSSAGTTGQVLQSAGAASPVWSTATYPATAGTSGNIIQSGGTNFTSVSLATAGIASSAITLTAGAGLTGGGDLTANRTFDVGAGTGITVNANDVALTAPVTIALGGTNSTTALSGSSIMVSDGTKVIQGAAGTTTTLLHGNAAGAPTYGAVSLTADVSGTLPIANGGTNGTTAAVNGGVVYSTATAYSISAAGLSGQLLRSAGAASPTWTTPTYPSTSPAAGKVLIGDGTNVIYSTPTFPNASATSGKIIISDGTNWIASTPTYPSAAGTSGNVLTSDGTNWLSSTPAGGTAANPTGTIGLSTVNGVLTTYMRSDAAPPLSQAITPTWTNVHTFSSESVHNGGIDLGTSGRVDSNVADAAGAVNFLFRPTTALTSGTDRYIFKVDDSTPTAHFYIASNGAWGIGSLPSTAGYITAANILTRGEPFGIFFGPLATSSVGASGAGFTTAVGGGFFQARPSTNASSLQGFGGAFVFNINAAPARTLTDCWGAVGQLSVAGTGTNASSSALTTCGSFLARGIKSVTMAGIPITNWAGFYAENASDSATQPPITNTYGAFFEEQTRGSSIKNGIFLASATATYNAIAIRDQNAWVRSDAAGSIQIGQAVTLASTSTDVVTCTGRMKLRALASDPRANSTAGTRQEVAVWDDRLFSKVQADATDKTWLKSDGVLFTATASATVTAVTISPGQLNSSTGVGSLDIPANILRDGREITIEAWGYLSTTATAGNYTITITIGGTTILTTAAFTPTALLSNVGWHLSASLVARDASAPDSSVPIMAQGAITYAENLAATRIAQMVNTGTTNIDATAANTCLLNAGITGVGSTSTITCTNYRITLLN